MKTSIHLLHLASRVRRSARAAVSFLSFCTLAFTQASLAENLVLDTFSWGAGTTRNSSITNGTSLNNVAPESQSATPGGLVWQTNGTVVFSGSAGPGNGSLLGSTNGVFKIANTPAGQCSAIIDWAQPGGSIGWQAASPSHNLLVNQVTDKVYCTVTRNQTTGAGKITVYCRIANVTVSANNNLTLTAGPTRVSISLDLEQRTASATVQDQTTGRSAAAQVAFPAGIPQWTTFAANTWSGAVAYQAEIASLKKLPAAFPINMGFKTLLSNSTAQNHSFDNNITAGRYAIHHSQHDKMEKIKTAYPELITISLNPEAAHGDDENRSNSVANTKAGEVWPGFWLLKGATTVTGNLGPGTTLIPVGNATGLIAVNDWIMISKLAAAGDNAGRPAWLNLPAGVSPRQTTGAYAQTFKPYFEYAQVTAISANNKTLTVTRNMTGTTANSYTANQTVVAAVCPAWKLSSEEDEPKVISQFRNNLALDAPRHPGTGENAGDFWARGRAANLNASINDGCETDVQYCLAPDTADVDLDLVADGGFINGINNYLLGYQEHVRQVREGIGPDIIMQYDCFRARNGYRGWKYVNGCQMETFIYGNFFSEAFDTLSQWIENAWCKPAFSYGYCRAPTRTYGNATLPDGGDADSLFRRQFAVGLMLGMPHPYGSGDYFGLFDWDEQRGGKLDDYTWLGQPLGTYQRDYGAMGSTDLIAGKTWALELDPGFNATASGNVTDANGMRVDVTQVPSGPRNYWGARVAFTSPQIQLSTNSSYTLVFDARASDTITYNNKTYEGLPSFINITELGTYKNWGALASSQWRHHELAYTTGPTAKFRAEFGLGEAKSTFWMKNIKLHTGSPNRLWRDFENGRVYLNESGGNWTFTAPTDGIYRRLRGEITPGVHTGAKATGSITVPDRDAVYLSKNRFTDWFDGHVLGANLSDTPPGTWSKNTTGYWTIVSEGSRRAAAAPTGGPQVSTVKTAEFNLGSAAMGNATNLDLQVDYKLLDDGGWHGVVFNLTGSPYGTTANAYIFKALGGNKTAQIVKKTGSNETVLLSGNCTTNIPVNEVLRLRVQYTAAGGKIVATLIRADGTLLFSGNTTNTAYTTGAVGVYAYTCPNYRVLKFDARARFFDP